MKTSSPHLSPAQTVINAFGGADRLAKLLGKHPSTICRWTKPRPTQGTGGKIPTHEQPRVLELARSLGIDLSPEDLIFGRDSEPI